MTMTLKDNLDAIRNVVDLPVDRNDIESVKDKIIALSGVIGLSAECKSKAKEQLELARLVAIAEVDPKLPTTLMNRQVDAKCSKALANYEYADRLNAAATHSIEAMRSMMSLYKSEMETERQNNYTP